MNVNFWTLFAPSLTRAPICLASAASHSSVVLASDAPSGLAAQSLAPCDLLPLPGRCQTMPLTYLWQLPAGGSLCSRCAPRKSFFSFPWFLAFCILFRNLVLIQHMEQQWRTLPRIQVHGELFSVSELNLLHSISFFAHLSEQNESELLSAFSNYLCYFKFYKLIPLKRVFLRKILWYEWEKVKQTP